jgi:hypothetical protein
VNVLEVVHGVAALKGGKRPHSIRAAEFFCNQVQTLFEGEGTMKGLRPWHQ